MKIPIFQFNALQFNNFKVQKMVFEEICVCVKDKLDLKYIYLFELTFGKLQNISREGYKLELNLTAYCYNFFHSLLFYFNDLT